MKLFFFSVSTLILFSACNSGNDDQSTNSIPVISINGANETTVSLGVPYTELGATANDLEDGNLTSAIVMSGAVNTQYTDTYHVFYDVVDSDGNHAAQTTRFVKVKNDADYLDGYYDVSYTYQASGSSGNRIDALESSKTMNNRVHVISFNSGRYFDVTGNSVKVYYSSDSIGYGTINSPTNLQLLYSLSGSLHYTDNYIKQ